MQLRSRVFENAAPISSYERTQRQPSVPPPRCIVNLNMFQSPDRRLGTPFRIGPVFKGTAADFTPVKIPLPLPDLSYTSFTCFSFLPYDIRHMVWKRAILVPRDLYIWPAYHGRFVNGNPDVELTPPLVAFTTMTRPPAAALHTSRESRHIALKHYVLSFGTETDCPSFHGAKICLPRPIYYNIEMDRVCFMPSALDCTPEGVSDWLSMFHQIFDQPRMSVAIHLLPLVIAISTRSDAKESILRTLRNHKDVVFYTVQDYPTISHIPRSPVTISFANWWLEPTVGVVDTSGFMDGRFIWRLFITDHLTERPRSNEKAGDRIKSADVTLSWASLTITE